MRNRNPKYYSYSKNANAYEVRKTINGEFHSFGYYPTELEAQFIVEGLKKADWNTDDLTGEYKTFWEEKTKPDSLKYIYKHRYGYSIDRKVNNKTTHYYHCKSLIECLMVRDLLINNDWDVNVIPVKTTYTNEDYIYPATNSEGYWIAKSINGKQEYFDYCNTLEQAIHERDLLVKYDWDIELVCENNDEILASGELWLNGKSNGRNIYYKQPNGRIDYDPELCPRSL